MSSFKQIEMTPTNKSRSRKLKTELQKEIAAKGDIHFRIDPRTYLALADLATGNRMGIGVLARSWVMQRLQQEIDRPAPMVDSASLTDLKIMLDKCLAELQQANRRLKVFEGGRKEPKLRPAKRA